MRVKARIDRIRFLVFRRIAAFFASKIGKVVVEEDRLRRLCSWRLCMSYNDSYFGEPNGLLKGIVAELEREMPAQKTDSNTQATKPLLKDSHHVG